LQKQNLSLYHKLNSKIEDEEYRDKIGETRRKDYISHFLLRLAFCRTEELRRWFISQETDLFRFRYIEESKEVQANFLLENKMEYTPVS
jgi:DNA primase large subunit